MRYSLILRIAAILVCALCASNAFGAEEGHAAPAAAPNPLSLAFDTALWTVFIFLGLLFILHRKAWGPILEGLQKREETIRTSLEEAKKTRDEMAKIEAQFQKDRADAQVQIAKLMEDARKKAEETSNEMRAKASAEIQAERNRLRREVEIAKDAAIKDLWEQAAQLATLISAKALGRSLTEDDHRRLLDEALSEMQANRN